MYDSPRTLTHGCSPHHRTQTLPLSPSSWAFSSLPAPREPQVWLLPLPLDPSSSSYMEPVPTLNSKPTSPVCTASCVERGGAKGMEGEGCCSREGQLEPMRKLSVFRQTLLSYPQPIAQAGAPHLADNREGKGSIHAMGCPAALTRGRPTQLPARCRGGSSTGGDTWCHLDTAPSTRHWRGTTSTTQQVCTGLTCTCVCLQTLHVING